MTVSENIRPDGQTTIIPASEYLSGVAGASGNARRANDRMKDLVEDDRLHRHIKDLRGSTAELRKRAEEYLPVNLGEWTEMPVGADADGNPLGGETLYEQRRKTAVLLDRWGDSIEQIGTAPFRQRILMEGYPDQVVEWAQTIDDEGRTIDEWGHDHFLESLYYGLDFSVTDNDPRTFDSLADRLENGRPYAVTVPRSSVLQMFRGLGPDGRPRLQRVTFWQMDARQDMSDPNAWEYEVLKRIRVIDAPRLDAMPSDDDYHPVSFLLEDRTGDNDWVEVPDSRRQIRPASIDERLRLDHIPFYPHYTKRIAPWRACSPFLNTGYMQLLVWQKFSELCSDLRELGWSRIGIFGVDDKGSADRGVTRRSFAHRLIESEKENGKIDVAELRGWAVEHGKENLEWVLKLIEQGHNQITSGAPRAPVSAREVTLEAVHASSKLEMWTNFHEHSWTRVVDSLALLGGYENQGRVYVPHDFGLGTAGVDELTALFMAPDGARIPPRQFAVEMIRRRVFSEDTDVDAFVEWNENLVKLSALKQGVGSGTVPEVAPGESEAEEADVAEIEP